MADRGLSAKIVTVSDGVADGNREDRSGLALADRLGDAGWKIVEHRITRDGVAEVAETLTQCCEGFAGLVVTTGGTGFGPRDLTPEGTREVIDREAPGLAEQIRTVSNQGGRGFGMLSRGIAGTRDRALIVNVPGSPSGAVEALDAILGAVPHALELLDGGHPH